MIGEFASKICKSKILPHHTQYSTIFFQIIFLADWHVPAWLQVSVAERRHRLALTNGITATVDLVSDTRLMSMVC
jgi:hypothetical protein